MQKLANDYFQELLQPLLLEQEKICFTFQDNLAKARAIVFTDLRFIRLSYYPERSALAEVRCRPLKSVQMFAMNDENDRGRYLRTMIYLYSYTSDYSDCLAFDDKEDALEICRFLGEQILR